MSVFNISPKITWMKQVVPIVYSTQYTMISIEILANPIEVQISSHEPSKNTKYFVQLFFS